MVLFTFAEVTLNNLTHKNRTEGRHERSILGEQQPSAINNRRDMELEDENRTRSVAGSKNAKKKKRKNAVTANLSGTRYDISKYTFIPISFQSYILIHTVYVLLYLGQSKVFMATCSKVYKMFNLIKVWLVYFML